MKIKNPDTGEIITVPKGMENAVRNAIESGNDPMEVMSHGGKFMRKYQEGGQPQQSNPEEQMQQLVQMAIQAIAQGASPEEVAQMLVEKGVPEQVVQQVVQAAMQQAEGQNPQEQQIPQEQQPEMAANGGKFLRKAQDGIYDGEEETIDPFVYPQEYNSNYSFRSQQPLEIPGMSNNPFNTYKLNSNNNIGINNSIQLSTPNNQLYNPNPNQNWVTPKQEIISFNKMGEKTPLTVPQGNNLNLITEGPNLGLSDKDNTNKYSKFNDYNKYIGNITGGNSYFGRGINHLGQATFDFAKGGIELAGANISNRNALTDEARDLQTSMRAGYQRVGKRPTNGNALISKFGGKIMQDGGATYADNMKVSKNNPQADFIAEKGEHIINNGIVSKLNTGGSHASGNDTAISLDNSQSPSYVLSDTPRLKQLEFGGKRVSPSKYAELATVEALGKTPDQILKSYNTFTKKATNEGKVFTDKVSNQTNQLLTQKFQKDLATVKQIADQAYHQQEQLKYAMGMDNDLDHAQQVNGIQMAQYGGSPELFSDPSGLGFNTTQMAYGGGIPKMGNAGNANPYSGWKGQSFSKPEGIITPTGVNLNADPRGNWADFAQKYSAYDPRITTKQTPEAIGALQEVIYDDYLDTPEGQKALNKMWLDFGVTNKLEKDYSDIATKIKNKEDLTENDLKKLRANYMDTFAGKRLPEMLKAVTPSVNPPATEAKPPKPPVEEDIVENRAFDYTTPAKKNNYDIPPVNFYIPQPYGRNPIGLKLAQAETIRPAKLNIQPELNEYTRGMRGALRGTQGNTSVNVAQQMQGLNNLYGAQNKLFGQKYNFDEQSRMGAEQFNAQAIMNVDSANIQRIGVQQDLINRREGALDTQRRTDFQAGLENAQKQNAYNLSKDYIENTFGQYLNNEGKLEFPFDPLTGKANTTTKEKPKKLGGSVKKVKLKLKK